MNLLLLSIYSNRFIDSAGRCLLSFLPSSTHQFIFSPSGAVESVINERRPYRAPLLQRLFHRCWLYHSVYTIYATAPLILFLYNYSNASRIGVTAGHLYPSAVLKLFACVWKASTLLWYLAFPPTVPDWVNLTQEDSMGVRRPKAQSANKTSGELAISWIDVAEVALICLCMRG